MSKKINITLDRSLWDSLSAFAHQESAFTGKRFTTIRALKTAIETFLRMEPREINEILQRKKLGLLNQEQL